MSTHSSKKDIGSIIGLLISLVFILAAVFYLVTSLISTIGRNSTKGEVDTSTLVANNAKMIESTIEPIGAVATSDGAGAAAPAADTPARSGEEVYTAVCVACHATGVANAPKLDDKAAWEPRVATGIDALMNTAINGKGAMPPRAGQNISDAELKAAIGYMTTKAGFSLDIPKDEAAPAAAPAAAAPAEAKAEVPAEPTTPPAAPEAPAAPEEAPAAEAAAPAEEAPAAVEAPVEAAAAAPVAEKVADSGLGEKTYKGTCFACHDQGVAGSPKLGDSAAWADRVPKGNDALAASAINGITGKAGVMPPKGGNLSLSDDEVKAAVAYMVSQVK